MSRMSLSNYVAVIVSLRSSYFKEQLRDSPVLTSLSLLFVGLGLLQAVSTLTIGFTPIPDELQSLIKPHIGKVKQLLLVSLPVGYLVRQIVFTPFLIAQSGSGFFRLYPIPNLYLSLTRWAEGWTSVSELVGNSFLFAVLSISDGNNAETFFQWICWCIIFRTTVAVVYELYCLVSDYALATFILYMFLLLWIMVDILSPSMARDLPKMSLLWSRVDEVLSHSDILFSFAGVLAFFMTSQVVCMFLYSYRMKKLGIAK